MNKEKRKMDQENLYVETAMLIQRPVFEVYEAFVNPDITTKFWFTKSNGKLVTNSVVDWTWEMFDHTVSVKVLSLKPNEKIVIQWGADQDAQVVWTFEEREGNSTYVKIRNIGFKGTDNEILKQIKDSTGGFTLVLAGLKAYLEHDIRLNLVADRYG